MAKKKPAEKASTNGREEAAPEVMALQVDYAFPEGSVPTFANQLVVQNDEHATTLSFFYAQPPALIGSPEEIKQKLQALQSSPKVKATLVAQIVVPRSRMQDFVNVIQTNLQRAIAFKKQADQSDSQK